GLDAADVRVRRPGLPAMRRSAPAHRAHRGDDGCHADPAAPGASERSSGARSGAVATGAPGRTESRVVSGTAPVAAAAGLPLSDAFGRGGAARPSAETTTPRQSAPETA